MLTSMLVTHLHSMMCNTSLSVPPSLPRIRRPLPPDGAIVACLRKLVSLPPCFIATTWSLSRFCSTMAVRIITMNALTSLSLKLPRTSCVWAMNLLTTNTLEPVFLCLHIFVCFCFLGAYREVLSGGLFTWRALRLEGCFSVCFFVFLSSYQMVCAIYVEIIIPIPYSIFHTLWRAAMT